MKCMPGQGTGFTLTARRAGALSNTDRISAAAAAELCLAAAGSLEQQLRIR
jgi:hypothetical protein